MGYLIFLPDPSFIIAYMHARSFHTMSLMQQFLRRTWTPLVEDILMRCFQVAALSAWSVGVWVL